MVYWIFLLQKKPSWKKAKNGDAEAQAKLRLTLTDYEREELEKALAMSVQGEAQSYGGYDPLLSP